MATAAPGATVAAAARPAAAALRVEGLVKRFDGRGRVLDGASFAVAPSEAVALIGANGAGKSTLLRCCLRLIEPDEGAIRLLDEDVLALPRGRLRDLRARVGFVFQRHNLVARLSALTNVVHGALARGAGPRAWNQATAPRMLREEASACLARVGLNGIDLARVDRLSGGQSQRVAIARALMQRPALVLADEPAASLDPAAAEEVMSCFADLARRDGVTLVFTSHNIRHALDYADRLVALRDGRVAIDAPTAGLTAASLRAFYG